MNISRHLHAEIDVILKNFKTLLIFLMVIIIPASSVYGINAVELSDTKNEYPIGKYTSYLKDKDKSLTIEKVVNPEHDSLFVKSDVDVPNFGYTSAAYWLKFKLKNNSAINEKWIIAFNYPLIDDIKIYTGSTLVNSGGRKVSFKDKDYKYRCFAFNISLKPGTEQTYYARVESEDSLPVPIMIQSQNGFTANDHISQYNFGIYYGLILVMILFNFFLFISTRDWSYLYYILSLISLHFFFQFSLNGFAFEYFGNDSTWWAKTSIAFFESLGCVFVLQFSRLFLKTYKHNPIIDKILKVIMLFLSIIALLSIFIKYYYAIQLTVVASMFAAIFAEIAGFKSYFNGYRPARFFIMAFSFLLFFGFFYAMKTLTLLPSNFFTEFSYQIGSALQALMLSFALGDMINYMRIETEKAQTETIKLQKEMNLGLEEKVRVRTEELQATMEEMEAINEQLIETRDALWGEMELAKKIQTQLLPVDPIIYDYDIAACMQTATEVGGDYYDIINAAGMDWIVIGDVSGHGVPAGLVMMMTQTAIHVTLAQNPDITPDNLLKIVNNTISDNIKRLGEDKYMTITVLAATMGGKFIFSGLHQDILIYRIKTGDVEYIETRGMWIGVADDINGMLELDSLSMNPGDVMLLYSDGITEAAEKDYEGKITQELFGDIRLGELFKSSAVLPVDAIKDAILKDLKNFYCGDDVTMVILKRKV